MPTFSRGRFWTNTRVPVRRDNSGRGEGYDKLRAFADFTGDEDLALVRFDDSLDQAQAQTQTSLGPAFVAALEPRPYFSRLIGGNAAAGVAETDNLSAILDARGNCD